MRQLALRIYPLPPLTEVTRWPGVGVVVVDGGATIADVLITTAYVASRVTSDGSVRNKCMKFL